MDLFVVFVNEDSEIRGFCAILISSPDGCDDAEDVTEEDASPSDLFDVCDGVLLTDVSDLDVDPEDELEEDDEDDALEGADFSDESFDVMTLDYD